MKLAVAVAMMRILAPLTSWIDALVAAWSFHKAAAVDPAKTSIAEKMRDKKGMFGPRVLACITCFKAGFRFATHLQYVVC